MVGLTPKEVHLGFQPYSPAKVFSAANNALYRTKKSVSKQDNKRVQEYLVLKTGNIQIPLR